MAEHTCTVRGPVLANPCPACQEHFAALMTKEGEVLAAVLEWVNSDRGSDDGTLMRVGREYAALKKASLFHG